VARLAAARGARVALIGLEPDRLRALAEDLGPTASWWEADVRDGAAVRSAIDDCAQTMGGLDIVVANAGVAATERCGRPTRRRLNESWTST
jgi:NAD(P)-dependent dehydrogenase (short-subunit alcohol dehydrogenase family)